MYRIWICFLSIAVGLIGSFDGSAQTASDHPASWLNEAGGVFFFQLTDAGDRLLVSRRSGTQREELVTVSNDTGTTQILYTSEGREIQNRIAISGDGSTVAFAKAKESRVYVVANPGAAVTVADVSPDRDPRNLALSADGRWIAFTASRVEGGGMIGRVQVNLYVAATDGSALHRITATPLPGKEIAFALSGDGRTLIWADNRKTGPIIANRDGSNAVRLESPGGLVERVSCTPDGSRVYCSLIDSTGAKIRSIARSGSTWTSLHETTLGWFAVAPGAEKIRLVRGPDRNGPGACLSVTGPKTKESLFSILTPPYSGSIAFSGNGDVAVWRAGCKTRIWRAEP